MRHAWRLWIGGLLSLLLAACTTTGRSFDASAMRHFVPGETTLAQARAWMGEPVALYQQVGGNTMARWARSDSLVADALYLNQELWLDFDAQGRYLRVANRINTPLPAQTPRRDDAGAAAPWPGRDRPGRDRPAPGWPAPVPAAAAVETTPLTVVVPPTPAPAPVPATSLPVHGPTGPLEANIMERGTTPALSLPP